MSSHERKNHKYQRRYNINHERDRRYMGLDCPTIKHRRPGSGVSRSVGGTHSRSCPLHLLDVVCVCEDMKSIKEGEAK